MPATAWAVVGAKIGSFIQGIVYGASITFQSLIQVLKSSRDIKRQNIRPHEAEVLVGGRVTDDHQEQINVDHERR